MYIIPDNDEIGKKHSESVAKSLFKKADLVKVSNLKSICPELPLKADITGFFHILGKAKGIELLQNLIETA